MNFLNEQRLVMPKALANFKLSGRKSLERITNQTGSTSATSSGAVSSSRTVAPLRPYPITATDFRTAPNRLTVDELADATPNLTRQQKEGLRTLYHQFSD